MCEEQEKAEGFGENTDSSRQQGDTNQALSEAHTFPPHPLILVFALKMSRGNIFRYTQKEVRGIAIPGEPVD